MVDFFGLMIFMFTPPKTNMSPENQWLVQMYFLFNWSLLVFRGVLHVQKPSKTRFFVPVVSWEHGNTWLVFFELYRW